MANILTLFIATDATEPAAILDIINNGPFKEPGVLEPVIDEAIARKTGIVRVGCTSPFLSEESLVIDKLDGRYVDYVADNVTSESYVTKFAALVGA